MYTQRPKHCRQILHRHGVADQVIISYSLRPDELSFVKKAQYVIITKACLESVIKGDAEPVD